MNRALRIGLVSLVFPLAALGCGNSAAPAEDAGGGDKAELEAAATLLQQPTALIAAYDPYLVPPDGKDVYAPKHRNDLLKAGECASGEIRFAANGARQKLKATIAATKDLEAALGDISKNCTDAKDDSAFAACHGSVKALDDALGKAAAAATAAGASAKFLRVTPDALTPEAKKAVAPFLKAIQPGPAEQAYLAKRSDTKASFADVSSACQAAADEAGQVSTAYAKADESIRLVAVTHKLSLDSQCNGLNAMDGLHKDLTDCKKKPKSTDCKVVCSKVKTRIEEGLPAGVFSTLEQEMTAICDK